MMGGATRRQIIKLGASTALALGFSPLSRLGARAQETSSGDGGAIAYAGEARHGMSAFGELKYASDFERFDYSNPDAPRGGTFVFQPPNWLANQDVYTFDTLNMFTLTGTAPARVELTYDALMTGALDEPDAVYGLIAETVTISEDGNRYRFQLRPEARFHDGAPILAADIVACFDLYRDERAHPSWSQPLNTLESVEATGERTVVFTFDGTQSRRTMLSIAVYPIFQASFFEAHPFDSSQLVAAPGSGPYRVGRVSAGRFVEYDRVDDYWAADLPVRRGLFHFDRIRVDFFRDRAPAFEAFKKGEILQREEFTSKTWATEYNFPAIADGRVVKVEFPLERAADFYGWAFNLRRSKFADIRTRQAIGLAFDYDWTNENLFYGLYERNTSYFTNSDFVAEGEPSEAERELLEPFRGTLAPETFGPAILPATSDGSGRDRGNLRDAARLLREAGWERQENGPLRNAGGETLDLEFLTQSEQFIRIHQPFVNNLRVLGIDASIRLVDPSQYERRTRNFEFDVTTFRQILGATPSEDGLRLLFGSSTANMAGANNLAGIANEAVDALIEHVGAAESRDEVTTAMRALDRVLRAEMGWLLCWGSGVRRVAHWDVFGYDRPKPDYGYPVEALWWLHREKAERIGRGL